MSCTIKQEALAALDRGWSVIPVSHALHDGRRIPLVAWKVHQTAPPAASKIRAWLAKWPDMMLGVVTGAISGLVVVDLDFRKGATRESLAQHGLTPSTWVVKTPGGEHHYYAHPGGSVPNSVGEDGVDVRGDGGYVVAPPSRRDTGQTYEWLDQDGTLPIFEDWRTPKVAVAPKEILAPNAQSWITQALRDGAAEGTRNSTLTRLVGYWAAREMPLDVIDAMAHMWSRDQVEPLPASEVTATVRSVVSAERRKVKPEQSAGLSIVSFTDFVDQYALETPTWVVPEWLPAETIGIIQAPPGSYKTWLMWDLAQAVANRGRFLRSKRVITGGPVLMIQQEDHFGQSAERLLTVSELRDTLDFDGEAYRFGPEPRLQVDFDTSRRFSFESKECMTALEEYIKRKRPKLVVIDPLYSALDVSDNMVRGPKLMWPLKQLRDQYGTSFLLIHHTRKSGGEDLSFDREGALGSQLLNGFIETGWIVRRLGDKEIAVRRHFKCAPDPGLLKITFDIDTDVGKYDPKLEAFDLESFIAEKASGARSDRGPTKGPKRKGAGEAQEREIDDVEARIRDALVVDAPEQTAAELAARVGCTARAAQRALHALAGAGCAVRGRGGWLARR